MKSINITILATLFAFSATAQEQSIAKVHYLFTHINDTTQRESYLRDEVVTYLGPSSSYFTSYSSARISQQLDQQMSSPTFDGNVVIKGTGAGIKESYLIDFAIPAIDIIKKVGTADFHVVGDFSTPVWQIKEDTKLIGGYTCQLATTTFKGRNYQAWFSPDIPLSYGPWKLNGLPGLILSAQDDKGEVVFEYAGFDKLEGDDRLLIALSPDVTTTTEVEIVKLENAFKANPSTFVQSQQAGRTQKVGPLSSGPATVYKAPGGMDSVDANKIKSVSIQKDNSFKTSAVTNNPIELTQ